MTKSTEEPQDETEESEDEIPEPESTMSKSETWDRVMKRAHDVLQEDFDDAVEIYPRQNLGMTLEDAEAAKAYEKL